MRSVFQYVRPSCLEDAVQFLGKNGAETVILAGGTDLMLAMRKGDVECKYVMDVSRLKELKVVSLQGDHLVIGAAVTYTELVESDLIHAQAPVISAAASCVGSEQIRNVGTLGGNVGNASPAADSIPGLMVHNARLEIVRRGEFITKPLSEIIMGPYRTPLIRGDLITKFLIDRLPHPYHAVYQRIGRRRAMAIARINLAATARLGPSGAICDFRMSIGSMTPQPYRALSVERMVIDKRPDQGLLTEVAALTTAGMLKLSGVRSSTEYKKPAAQGLIIKSLSELFGIPINEGESQ